MKGFLKRKKAANFLEMIPVRNVQEFSHDENRITLIIPKFRNAWMLKWLIPPRRSKQFRVHLDETGSRVWELIDGIRDTEEICRLLHEQLQGDKDALDIRVTGFLRQLYKSRFILFK